MKKRYYLSLLFLVLISCSYNFSEDAFQDLEIPTTSDKAISLIDFNELDVINEETEITYRFEGAPNQSVVNTIVYLDDQEIRTDRRNNTGTFSLFPSRYKDGVHDIKVQVFFSSGSGSIKDQASLEILETNSSFQFTVKRYPAVPPQIKEVKMEAGSVRINWSAPVNKDFKEAFLSLKYKYSEVLVPLSQSDLDSGTYLDKYTILFTKNTNTPEYDHYSSVDYSIVYRSEFNAVYGQKKTLVDDPSAFKIKIGYHDDKSFKVVWNQHPFYGNFSTFKYGNLDFSSLGGEYIFDEPYILGQNYAHPIVINEGNRYLAYNYYEMALDENSLGLFDFNHLYAKGGVYNPSNKNYYALVVEDRLSSGYVYYIYKYSEDMDFIEKSYVGGFEKSDVAENIYLDPIDHNIYVDTFKNSYLIDKNALQVIKSYVDSNDDSNSHVYRNNIVKQYNYTSDQLTITNTTTGDVLYSNTHVNPGYLSRSGEYVYLQKDTENAIYKISNNTLEKVYDLNSDYYVGSNMFFDDDTVYYVINNDVFIVNLTSKSVKTFSFGSVPIKLQVDTEGENILLIQNGPCAVYDINTEEIKTFTYQDDKFTTGKFYSEDRSYYVNLYNNRLLHSKGIFINNF